MVSTLLCRLIGLLLICTIIHQDICAQDAFFSIPEYLEHDKKLFRFKVTSLTDADYPDNPDIGFRTTDYASHLINYGELRATDNIMVMDATFHSTEEQKIKIENLHLSEFIPTIPEKIKSDNYLSHLSCINQEWNRNQVRFMKGEFSSDLDEILRVDIARNCLNAYLWEIIIYKEENGQLLPHSHGWFDFPKKLYAELFEMKNGRPWSDFQDAMENWEDPKSKKLDLNLLRTVQQNIAISYRDLSDAMYPVKKARAKKLKEIITPTAFESMRDLQSDETTFATFTPPGFYNRSDPRTTELGRIHQLTDIQLSEVDAGQKANATLNEVVLKFRHRNQNLLTHLIIGGIDLSEIPVISPERANEGWKNSMGIGNHSFYERYQDHLQYKTDQSPYYALLTDEKNKWLDSHKIGIDGPILHYSDEDRTELHLWLLSFERHALVGHYVIKMK